MTPLILILFILSIGYAHSENCTHYHTPTDYKSHNNMFGRFNSAPPGAPCTQETLCQSRSCGLDFNTHQRVCCLNSCLFNVGGELYCGPLPQSPLQVGDRCRPETPWLCPWVTCGRTLFTSIYTCCPSCFIRGGYCLT